MITTGTVEISAFPLGGYVKFFGDETATNGPPKRLRR